MNNLNGKYRILAFFAVLTISLTVIAIIPTDNSEAELAQASDVKVSPSTDQMNLKPGDSDYIYLDIKSTLTKQITVYVIIHQVPKDIKVTFPDGNRVLVEPDEISYCRIHVSIDKYAEFTKKIFLSISESTTSTGKPPFWHPPPTSLPSLSAKGIPIPMSTNFSDLSITISPRSWENPGLPHS